MEQPLFFRLAGYNSLVFLTTGIMEHMLTTKTILHKPALWFILLVLLTSACSTSTPSEVAETATPSEPTVTSTPAPPTATPVPAAAIVNGEVIPLAMFEDKVARYLAAQEAAGTPVEDEAAARQMVLNDLVDQVLLAQGAAENGLSVSEQAVRARLDALADEVDLAAWMAAWGYTEDDLFQSLRMQLTAAAQRDRIAESIPGEIEQVELQQVFAYTEEGAKSALVSLNSGRDFDDVAFTYDPTTGGYLGWVPRGYLLIPAVEDAAFSLEIGAYSEIIESDIGYHIVMVLARETRPLSYDARTTLQRQAVRDWIAERRQDATIEILID